MTAVAVAADPLVRVAELLRARQVSCRGGLDDLAQAVLTAAQTPPRPSPAPPPPAADELVWRRERIAVLMDRDTLVSALQDLVDAVADHTARRTRITAAAVAVAVGDAREVLEAPGDIQAGGLDAAA